MFFGDDVEDICFELLFKLEFLKVRNIEDKEDDELKGEFLLLLFLRCLGFN